MLDTSPVGPTLAATHWLDDYSAKVAREENDWRDRHLSRLPAAWRARVKATHTRKLADHGKFHGNTWLRELSDEVRRSGALALDTSNAELRTYARETTHQAEFLCAELIRDSRTATLTDVRVFLERIAHDRGIPPPDAKIETEPAIARLLSSDWWARRLRQTHGRRIEKHAIDLNFVHKAEQCYVSNANLRRRTEQRARNARALESVDLENQHGETFSLAELVAKSNANPRIRRGELMTRIAGFEKTARELGHAAEFITVTAPSRFHAVLSKTCQANPKHEGATPRDAQQHLVKAWAQCRAALARRGLDVYGFRIAEPHHDGCPHWHLLLFMPSELSPGRSAVSRLRAIVRRYFWRKHDAHEAGAKANRCKFVAIDWRRGTAAGYVAKYVAKNIDGFGLDADEFGNSAETGAARVDAWAATWGIRQFQQIGGAPVGVWRELRRIGATNELSPAAEECRSAADTSGAEAAEGWARYTAAQGGPCVARNELTVTTARTASGEKWVAHEERFTPGENRYGEPCSPSTIGVKFQREGSWCVEVSRRLTWTRVSRTSDRRREPASTPAKRAPWSSVNNCTQTEQQVEQRGKQKARSQLREMRTLSPAGCKRTQIGALTFDNDPSHENFGPNLLAKPVLTYFFE